ncbi:MAG TPA: family 16 glycosylhydrolase [Bacteroidales bacterium]|nr:family 16 glycosylhydrolase [Bacteroidales bacterium]
MNMVYLKKKKLLKRTIIKNMLRIMIIFSWFIFSSCEENNSEDGFSADFTYEFIDDNHVHFVNASDGEYYSLMWDFGNEEADTTTDKKKTYTIYYPVEGDYEVSLKLLNYSGETKTVNKSINVPTTDFIISFTAEVDNNNPNYVLLTNTSIGEYDSFKWVYRNREVENETEFEAYFPFAGSYEIELQVFKGANMYPLKKTVNIAQDDPDYIDNMTLAWSDEFDGATINTDNWTFETGATGWGNNELQNYTNGDNAELVDGKLIITARKVDENMEVGSYTSSRIISEGKKEFQYGRLEIRAKLPSGTGIWPAIWMLGSNFRSVGWPACGEMDIMEYVGYEPDVVHSTVHTPSGYGGNGDGSSKSLVTCEEEFHIYGLFWTEKELVFYTDNIENVTHIYNPTIKTTENWPFDQPHFFILNVAVGGNWGGAQGIDNSIFPQKLEIDYVRVYQEAQ